MALSAHTIAETIIEKMHKQNLDCTTIPWHKFYILCCRERIKAPFLKQLKVVLRHKSFLLVDGNAVVTITKDFNFAELK